MLMQWAIALVAGLAGAALGAGAALTWASERRRTERRDADAARAHLIDRMDRSAADLAALREVLDTADAPILATDPAGRVASANRAAEALIGRGSALIGRPIDEAFPQAEVLSLHAQAASGSPARGRTRLARRDGYAWLEVSALPRQGGGVVLAVRDVSELATAVQLKTDFVANASHELRTPIAAIRGAVETLGVASEDRAMSERLRRMIADHVARLEAMIADLLDLSRLESPELRVRTEPVDALDLCVRVGELFDAPFTERGLRLELDLDPALSSMSCDGTLLELVLRNLIENASKFARERTAVRVLGRVEPVRPAPDTPWQPPPDAVGTPGAVFRVIDEGQGIPLRDQQRIFERFYQVDPSRDGGRQRRGTGLGLAIVKHAVRRMGGRVSVQSVWQQGTTMQFELPMCVRPPEEPGEPAATLTGPPRATRT